MIEVINIMAYYECSGISKPKTATIRASLNHETYYTEANGIEHHHFLELYVNGIRVVKGGIFFWDDRAFSGSIQYNLSL